MLKERILKVDLETLVELFAAYKWKFFEDRRECEGMGFNGIIRIEHPIGADEAFIVNLSYSSLEDFSKTKHRLLETGFIEQEIRTVAY